MECSVNSSSDIISTTWTSESSNELNQWCEIIDTQNFFMPRIDFINKIYSTLVTSSEWLSNPDSNFKAQYCLGSCYAFKKEYTNALKYLTLALNQGFIPAHNVIAKCYLYSHDKIDCLDYDARHLKAFEHYSLSAKENNAEGQLGLGDLYSYGNHGIKENRAEALKYYKLSANQGNTEALIGIGRCYHFGGNIPQDKSKAFKYYKLSADQKNPQAFESVGFCYSHLIGVERNYKKAIKYLSEAIRFGNYSCEVRLCDIFFRISHPITRIYSPENATLKKNFEKIIQDYTQAIRNGNRVEEIKLHDLLLENTIVDNTKKIDSSYKRKKETKKDLEAAGFYYANQSEEPNFEKAIKYYSKGIRMGSSYCEQRLLDLFLRIYDRDMLLESNNRFILQGKVEIASKDLTIAIENYTKVILNYIKAIKNRNYADEIELHDFLLKRTTIGKEETEVDSNEEEKEQTDCSCIIS